MAKAPSTKKKPAAGQHRSLLTASEPASRRRGINSVETGMRVLECIVALGGPSSLKAIVEKAKLQPSQAHRYVSSLVNSGILRQDRATGFYDVGPAALRIGLYAIARQDALGLVDQVAMEISEKEKVAATVLVWGTSGPTAVRHYKGTPPLYAQVGVGATFPVSGSVAGRVFMAYLSEDEVHPFLEAEGFSGKLDDHPQLAAHRTRIRKARGDLGESAQIPGLRACAAPIFGLDHTVVAVMAIPLPREVSASRFKALFAMLIAQCRMATRDLGGEWPDDDSGE